MDSGLPDVPITDVILEHHDQAMASHGLRLLVARPHRPVKAQLDERPAADNDDTLIAAASVVEGESYQVRNRASQDRLGLPIKVNNRLAKLPSMSERGGGRPESGMSAVFEILLVERLGGLIVVLEGVWSEEPGEVNARLREMGVGEIVVEAPSVAMGESARYPDVTLGLKGRGLVRATIRGHMLGLVNPIEELMAELEWEDGGAVDGCRRSIVSESGSTQR